MDNGKCFKEYFKGFLFPAFSPHSRSRSRSRTSLFSFISLPPKTGKNGSLQSQRQRWRSPRSGWPIAFARIGPGKQISTWSWPAWPTTRGWHEWSYKAPEEGTSGASSDYDCHRRCHWHRSDHWDRCLPGESRSSLDPDILLHRWLHCLDCDVRLGRNGDLAAPWIWLHWLCDKILRSCLGLQLGIHLLIQINHCHAESAYCRSPRGTILGRQKDGEPGCVHCHLPGSHPSHQLSWHQSLRRTWVCIELNQSRYHMRLDLVILYLDARGRARSW